MRFFCAFQTVALGLGLCLAPIPAGASRAALTNYGGSLTYTTAIAPGRDGNIWFTEYAGAIGKITPSGKVTEYGGSLDSPDGIAAGPDGNMWFVEQGNGDVGKITRKGVITRYATGAEDPGSIAAGPDGNMWFTDDNHNKIGKITPAGSVTEYGGRIQSPNSITRGPDGNMWFTEKGKIGKITPAGKITEYGGTLDSPDKIALGPDHRLWFVKWGRGRIGAISTNGKVTLYGQNLDWVRSITAGADGNLWFTQETTLDLGGVVTMDSKIGKITPSGKISLYAGPQAAAEITLGPEKNLWFIDEGYSRKGKHGMIGKFVPALAVAIAPAAPVVAGSAADNANLASILHRVIPAAGSRYASLRGALVSQGDAANVYAPNKALNTLCGVCAFADEFGNESYHEVWTFTLTWYLPASWDDAKTAAFVARMLGPNVSGYALTRETKDGKTTFDWENKANHTWIYVATLGSKEHGFSLRVGYYPPKETHVVQYSRGLSTAEQQHLVDSVRTFIRTGVQNAADNFTLLRGKSTSPTFYDTNESFGTMLSGCSISGILFSGSSSDTESKWTLDCSTPTLGGTSATNLELIRSTVAAALPSDFTATTDPQYLVLDDYRWDRSSDQVAVSISETSGSYTLTIFHFVPNH